MDITDIPLFSMLRGRIGYLSDRQRLIAQNVANAETPGYSPNDLKPFTLDTGMKAQATGAMAVTQPGHMALPISAQGGGQQKFKAQRIRDSETTLDGNSVVLEEEMLKMTDARMSYDAAISFYQKSLAMLQMASRAPGK